MIKGLVVRIFPDPGMTQPALSTHYKASILHKFDGLYAFPKGNLLNVIQLFSGREFK
jgi:hypothetical protein